MTTLFHQFAFRPVGQGLFVHGSLFSKHRNRPFNWLYDCGTSSRYSILQNQIAQYNSTNCDKIIDLGMLSHFDQDHVNGILELVKECRIKTLVLPYLYPGQRCLLLAGVGGAARWYQQFLQSPATYLLQAAGENIERVVLVGPSGGEPPPEPEGEGEDIDPDGGIQWPPPKQNQENDGKRTGEPNEPIDGFSKGQDHDLQGDHRIQSTDSSRPLSFHGLWEFCFYNRPQDPKDLQRWWKDAEPVWRLFQQSGKEPSDYDSLIAGMKQTLAKNPHLPKSRFDANEVSLQVYAGPVSRRLRFSRQWHSSPEAGSSLWKKNRIWWGDAKSVWKYFEIHEDFPWPDFPFHHHFFEPSYDLVELPQDAGFLFTGDVTMDASTSLMTRCEFIGESRWQRLGYLQVPHHGARRSWRPNVYRHWHHRYSVFSARGSDGGYAHPHPEVVEDLEDHGTIEVTSRRGLVGAGAYLFH